MRRMALSVVGLAMSLLGTGAQGQGVQVDHKPVDCVVAGKYARLNACFSPAGSVARARLYFKIQSSPTWYYVDMKSEVPCWAGVLPKAKKSLVPQKLSYYVQVFDQSMAEGRSQEHTPTIVGSEGDCGTDKILAPLSGAGPAAVFPALPAGFVAGAGATPLVLGGVAVAGAVGGGVALATKGGDPAPTPTPIPTPLPSPIPIPTPTPKPPPATLEVSCTAEPTSGPAPLDVMFNATPTGGTGVYDYRWEFGTGEGSGNKRVQYTYRTEGSYDALLTVKSGSQTASCKKVISVGKSGSKVTVTTQWNTAYDSGQVTSSPGGISCYFKAPTAVSGACSAPFVAGSPLTLTLTCPGTGATPEWQAGCDSFAGNQCFLTPTADRAVQLKCYIVPTVAATAAGAPSSRFRTSLEASGARARVVVDGAGMVPVEPGGQRQVELPLAVTHRIEAVVDEIKAPGLWRFDLSEVNLATDSVQVLTGEVVQLAPGFVVFRLSGRAGERIAFLLGSEKSSRK